MPKVMGRYAYHQQHARGGMVNELLQWSHGQCAVCGEWKRVRTSFVVIWDDGKPTYDSFVCSETCASRRIAQDIR